MDVKLKYRTWVNEKYTDISNSLTNSDIETFAIEFAEWLIKNCSIPAVVEQSERLSCPDCTDGRDEFEPDWKCPECRQKDESTNDTKPVLTTVELQELEESNRNGMDWFDSYQDVDNFLFNELDKKGLEFVTNFEKPHLNTIASIKLLIYNCV